MFVENDLKITSLTSKIALKNQNLQQKFCRNKNTEGQPFQSYPVFVALFPYRATGTNWSANTEKRQSIE